MTTYSKFEGWRADQNNQHTTTCPEAQLSYVHSPQRRPSILYLKRTEVQVGVVYKVMCPRNSNLNSAR